jgi:GT2 family glycosyltransferase
VAPVVVCVPWRGGHPQREFNWSVVKPWLESLGYPIYLGDRAGPWSRAAACNQAAREAGDWDVAIFADADTLAEEDALRRAVDTVISTAGAVRPHDKLWNLSHSESTLVQRRGVGALKHHPKRRLLPGGGLLVVHRDAWDKVGGHDERFIGWGHEDSALNTRLLVEASWDRISGNAWHLWHQRDSKETPERKANWAMMHELQHRYREDIERESTERGWDIGAVL